MKFFKLVLAPLVSASLLAVPGNAFAKPTHVACELTANRVDSESVNIPVIPDSSPVNGLVHIRVGGYDASVMASSARADRSGTISMEVVILQDGVGGSSGDPVAQLTGTLNTNEPISKGLVMISYAKDGTPVAIACNAR
jgi:hypothetical protein